MKIRGNNDQPGKKKSTLDQVGAAINKGVTKAARAVLPINVAMLAQDLTGNAMKRATGDNFLTRGTPTPLTEKDLTPAERAVLKDAHTHKERVRSTTKKEYPALKQQIAKEKGISEEERGWKNLVADGEYKEAQHKSIGYDDYKEGIIPDPRNVTEAIQAVVDPGNRVATTLGRAAYTTDKAGNTVINDRFNFDGESKKGVKSLYNAVHTLARTKGSNTPDAGIPVKINLKDAPKKKAMKITGNNDKKPTAKKKPAITNTQMGMEGKNQRMTPKDKKVPALELVSLDPSMKKFKDGELPHFKDHMDNLANRTKGMKGAASIGFKTRSREVSEEIRDRETTRQFRKARSK
jgi:hypothetical protein